MKRWEKIITLEIEFNEKAKTLYDRVKKGVYSYEEFLNNLKDMVIDSNNKLEGDNK